MSHTTKLKSVVIRDVAALKAAAAELQANGVKCAIVENAKPRMYFANQHKDCPYVLKLDGPYDVGFEQQEDGTFVPVFDEHANYVGNVIGAGKSCPMPNTREGRAQHQMGKFFAAYSKHAAVNAAVQQGYFVESSSVDAEGNTHIVLAGM
jgi:hypothetical protein